MAGSRPLQPLFSVIVDVYALLGFVVKYLKFDFFFLSVHTLNEYLSLLIEFHKLMESCLQKRSRLSKCGKLTRVFSTKMKNYRNIVC